MYIILIILYSYDMNNKPLKKRSQEAKIHRKRDF